MTSERFKLRLSKLGNGMITDTQKREDLYFDKEFLDATLPKANEWLNKLDEENEQLKETIKQLEAQLHCPFDSICIICVNEYLVKKDNYYISKCKKRHEECSKIDMTYCSDFELKDNGNDGNG